MMMELKNVARYYPEDMPYGEGIQYFQSEDGEDFYESIPLFKRKYKMCIEPDTGVIRSIAEDVSMLYPVGFTIVETNYLPDGCDIYGGWMYENEVVKAIPVDYAALAESEREARIDEANELINEKQWPSKLTLGRLSDTDKATFNLWLDYLDSLDPESLVLSNVVDEETYKAISWPDKPDGE